MNDSHCEIRATQTGLQLRWLAGPKPRVDGVEVSDQSILKHGAVVDFGNGETLTVSDGS